MFHLLLTMTHTLCSEVTLNQPFTVNVISDDDEEPMTKSQFKQLNEKLDSVLEYSHAFSSTKWENLVTTHIAIVEMLTSTNAKVLKESSKAAQDLKKKISEAIEKGPSIIKINQGIYG